MKLSSPKLKKHLYFFKKKKNFFLYFSRELIKKKKFSSNFGMTADQAVKKNLQYFRMTAD